MTFQPDFPFPKSQGDDIRSKDWNDLVNEVSRLDTDKVDKTAEAMTGPLTIDSALGIGTSQPNFPLSLGSSLGYTKLALYETGATNSYGMGILAGQFRFHTNGTGARFAFFSDNATNATEVFTIRGSGNVGIGAVNPAFKLDVRGSDGWIGSGDASQSRGGWRLGRWPEYSANDWVYLSRADSFVYQDLAVGALWAGGALRFGTADDLAEMTPVNAEDHLEPGDVVIIDNPPDNRVLLSKSNKPCDFRVAGVISDANNAGLIIGGSHPTDITRDDVKPIALAGRVLTKVTAENGAINVGDALTSSSIPGHAMKATEPGCTLGKALQPFSGSPTEGTTGKIWVLVSLTKWPSCAEHRRGFCGVF